MEEPRYAMIEEEKGMEFSVGSLLEYAPDWIAQIEVSGYANLKDYKENPTLIFKAYGYGEGGQGQS